MLSRLKYVIAIGFVTGCAAEQVHSQGELQISIVPTDRGQTLQALAKDGDVCLIGGTNVHGGYLTLREAAAAIGDLPLTVRKSPASKLHLAAGETFELLEFSSQGDEELTVVYSIDYGCASVGVPFDELEIGYYAIPISCSEGTCILVE